MVFPRINLSFMAASTSNPAASSLFGPYRPFFISKTRCSVLQSYAATYFTCSSIGCRDLCTKGSQIKFRRPRLASSVVAQRSKSSASDSRFGASTYRYFGIQSRNGISIRSLVVFGSATTPTPFCNPCLSSRSVRFSCEGFAKRMYSAKALPKSVLSSESISEPTVSKEKKFSRGKYFFVSRHRKRLKAMARQASANPNNTVSRQLDKKGIAEGQTSAKAVNSTETKLGDGHEEIKSPKPRNAKSSKSRSASGTVDSEQGSNVKSKSQSKSKSKKGSPSSTVDSEQGSNVKSKSQSQSKSKSKSKSKKGSTSSTVDSEQESNAKSISKQGSRSKKKEPTNVVSPSDSQPAKNRKKTKDQQGQSPKKVESSSAVRTAKEDNGLTHSTEVPSKKKVSHSGKQRRNRKVAEPKENTNGALPRGEKSDTTSRSKPVLNPVSPAINGMKPKKLQPLYPPAGKSVVVVESVAKAKVIQGYLGSMYDVVPSYGHVRDLAGRSGSVRPDDDFSMVWEVPSSAWTHLNSIKVALSGADYLILASDPDREGEAIAWHVIEMLQQQGALSEDMTIARVVFHEITESAIKSALTTPRIVDVNLVHAYLARRALDYLIGFNISPLLWRKLPGCQSAGRVQSAALCLICDREIEIDEFKPQEYWTVDATFNTSDVSSAAEKGSLQSHLTHFNSKKLNQLSISSEAEAKNVEQFVGSSRFKVTAVKRTKVNRNPPTPYITSTLQQDAANKLSFSAAYTMKVAQKLYEGIQFPDGKAAGLITYLRTDGLHISDEAVKEIRSLVAERYGREFAANEPRKYFKKVKNAQEAHEAIRPTDIRRLPSMLTGLLNEDSLKLYTLIWARTVACQMEPAKFGQIQIDVGNDDGSISFRAACSAVDFPGFRSVYDDAETQRIRDNENGATDRDGLHKFLSNLKHGDPLSLCNLDLGKHSTQPPPRFSEASLVKKLEELGIGRPSTYASTLKVLQDRKYITTKSRVLHPEFRGRMVSAFLSHYFTEVTDYSFTADMETELDNVSAGLTEWKGLLKDYWSRFRSYCDNVGKVPIHQVERMLEKSFGHFLFSSVGKESRTCPSCSQGTLIFRVSRYGLGYFIGCDQHPNCKYIAKTYCGDDDEDDDSQENRSSVEEPKLLGTHPVTGEKVLLKNGPFGHYAQLGEDRKGHSPKRASIHLFKDVKSFTLEDALELFRYPITLGVHEDGHPVMIKIAKQGFSIKHRRFFIPIPKHLHPKDVTMEKALALLASNKVTKCGRPKGRKVEESESEDED